MSDISLSERISWAEDNLKRQLDWISRHDSRIAVIFGICVAMLGVLATQAIAPDKLDTGSVAFSLIALVFLIISLIAIYFSQYPRTVSSTKSLLFFGDIAHMERTDFARSFCARTGQEHLDDLCDQSHINAVIIGRKFAALKVALVFLLAASIPWVIAIGLLRIAKGG
ncbi:MAG: hypothetical protein H0U98_18185 [Alphaproteobacteria bacterium]|nr:hypothetical protein [Alphaproteobacteria bacterium]